MDNRDHKTPSGAAPCGPQPLGKLGVAGFWGRVFRPMAPRMRATLVLPATIATVVFTFALTMACSDSINVLGSFGGTVGAVTGGTDRTSETSETRATGMTVEALALAAVQVGTPATGSLPYDRQSSQSANGNYLPAAKKSRSDATLSAPVDECIPFCSCASAQNFLTRRHRAPRRCHPG